MAKFSKGDVVLSSDQWSALQGLLQKAGIGEAPATVAPPPVAVVAAVSRPSITVNVNGKVLTVKVSEKGAVSVYGMGRFPFTFYADQLLTILGAAPQLAKFVTDNAASLARKAS